MPAIELDHLRKAYGDVVAVDDLTLEVPRGSVFGLVGRNGAGKSTTLNLLIGLLRPDGGSARIEGHDVRESRQARHMVSFVSEEAGIYPWLTGAEAARYMARLSPRWNDAAFRQCVAYFDLPLTRAVAKLSKGMRTQLLLALAVAREPSVYILDEPTSGLDPLARRHLFRLLDREVGEKGRTVLLSSHVLSELSDACTHVAVIERGRLKLAGELRTLRGQWRKYECSCAGAALDDLASSLGVTTLQKRGDDYTLLVAGDHERTMARLQDLPVTKLRVSDVDLEEIFFSVIGENGAGDASAAPRTVEVR